MSAPWPELVWSSPLLRGLDARGRREITAAGALLERAAGEVLFKEGAPADGLFVVLEGEVALSALGRGKTVERVERRVGAGDTLGEEALLGPHAVRDGDALATTPVVAASVPWVVLTRALVRAGGAELEA
ncbi:MAG TPA: cyclic nucleotide-binding domain-containing protein, partial [Polyangiaceae bacterium]|nr:cyclic nucleotide-binding domain-containing protein [Polyangiaceae bacterium]